MENTAMNGFVRELQALGYVPARKCESAVLLRPKMVTTEVFAEVAGLNRNYVQSLCARKLIPCMIVGTATRHKYMIDLDAALEKLTTYAERGASLPCVVDKVSVTADEVKRMRKPRQRRNEYKLSDDVLAKKKALKAGC